MTKFFIPTPRGPPKGFAHPPKIKKNHMSCSQSLQKRVMQLLKKLLTRKIQKTIRLIREQKEEKDKQKLIDKLNGYKSISKHHLKHLSYFILLDDLNVELQSLKKNFNIPSSGEQKPLPEQVNAFYQEIKQKQSYKNQIQDAQRIKNQVSDKKKIKKEKAKLKKKTKLQIRKEVSQKNSEMVVNEEGQDKMIQQSKVNDQNESSDSRDKLEKEVRIKVNTLKPQKTQFKKTGRNKYLQEKRQKRQKKFTPQIKDEPKKLKVQVSKRDETPHPSWQAKRQIKNQMFIQPFAGKKILL